MNHTKNFQVYTDFLEKGSIDQQLIDLFLLWFFGHPIHANPLLSFEDFL